MRGKKNPLGDSFPSKEEDGEKCMRQIGPTGGTNGLRQLCGLAGVAGQVGIGKKRKRQKLLQGHIFVLKTD